MTHDFEAHAKRVEELVMQMQALTSPVCLGYKPGVDESRIFASAYLTFALRLAGDYIASIQAGEQRDLILKTATDMLSRVTGQMVDIFWPEKAPACPIRAVVPGEPLSTPGEHAVAERDMHELLAKIRGKSE